MGEVFRRDRKQGGDAPPVEAQLRATTAPTRRAFLGRLTRLLERQQLTDEFWEELEETLLLADVGPRTTGRLLAEVREQTETDGLREAASVQALLRAGMLKTLLGPRPRGALWGADADPPPPPHVILIVGVNGTGKTTTMAKLAHAYLAEGRSVILGAADTFRAAGIDQVVRCGQRLGIDVVAHQPRANPGAVAYDTVAALQARSRDVALIDTAGRLASKKQLMRELTKISRAVRRGLDGAPHEVLLVLDAGSGQNGLEQARAFREAVDVTSVCLAKLDSTARGGIAFTVVDQLELPVQFVGTGTGAADLVAFDPQAFVAGLFGEDVV